MNVTPAVRDFIGWVGIILTIVSSIAIYRLLMPAPKVQRYRCIVTVEPLHRNEVICFQPDGSIFRPERRFNEFILEVKQ